MKKRIILLAGVVCIATGILAQPTLVYEAHHLKPGIDNAMSICKYVDPGIAGEDRVWDFSQLEFVKTFNGSVKPLAESDFGSGFNESNTALTEFNSLFFFHIDDTKIEQYGYSSADGRVQTHYTVPFVKMRYPFSYGDIFSGSFSGTTYYSGVEAGEISGSYTVSADAWGQLILPGETKYDNTLRVHTEKTYVNESGSNRQDVTISTYRWYNSVHRYPLLVLTEYSVSSGANLTINYQAAYNSNAVGDIPPIAGESIMLYPNPTVDELMLEYTAVAAGTLSFTILDSSGKIVRGFEHEIVEAGTQQYSLSDKISGLKPSNYILLIRNGDHSISRSFTIQY